MAETRISYIGDSLVDEDQLSLAELASIYMQCSCCKQCSQDGSAKSCAVPTIWSSTMRCLCWLEGPHNHEWALHVIQRPLCNLPKVAVLFAHLHRRTL